MAMAMIPPLLALRYVWHYRASFELQIAIYQEAVVATVVHPLLPILVPIMEALFYVRSQHLFSCVSCFVPFFFWPVVFGLSFLPMLCCVWYYCVLVLLCLGIIVSWYYCILVLLYLGIIVSGVVSFKD